MSVNKLITIKNATAGLVTPLVLLASLLSLCVARPSMAEQGPVDVLQDMTDQVIEIIEQEPDIFSNPARMRAVANEVILPHIDFNALSRWVLGKYWRKATPQQRHDFAVEFQELLLGSYMRQVTTYKENVVRFMPLREGQKEGRVTVYAEVEQTDGPIVHATFRMHRVNTQWLIYDVAVEGISLVATHRSGFSREIHNSGIDSLIARLQTMNARNASQEESVLAGTKQD
jgi:phospholipid transport system substrate-binding protein